MSDEKARGIHARIPGQLSSERGFREMRGNACSLMMQFLLEMLAIASIHIQKIPLYRGTKTLLKLFCEVLPKYVSNCIKISIVDSVVKQVRLQHVFAILT